MTRSIEIENVRSVGRLSIQLPEKGVVEAYGWIGSGKSTTLQAVEALLGRRPASSLPLKRGELSGRVAGLGREIILGASRRPSARGDLLEVHGLVGGCDPSAFADPGIEKPDSADAARLREAIRIAGIEIDDEAWSKQLGELWADMPEEIRVEADPIQRWKKVKAQLEEWARNAEAVRDRRRADEGAKRKQIEGWDLDVEPAPEAATQAAMDASATLARLKSERAQWDAAQSQAQAARKALASVEEPNLDELRISVEVAENASSAANAEVSRLQKELSEARVRAEGLAGDLRVVRGRLDDARRLVESIAAHRATIEKAEQASAAVSDDALAKAEADARDAMARSGRATEAARLRKLRDAADVDRDEAARVERVAFNLRDHAKSCENVLVQAWNKVAPDGLTFEAGRFICQDRDGARMFYADASEGMRWVAAVRLAVRGAGERGIVCMEGWERVNDAVRQQIREEVERLGAVLIVCSPEDNPEVGARVMEASKS